MPGQEKEYQDYILRLSQAYRHVSSNHRKEFEDRLKADPTLNPERIAADVEVAAIRSQLISVRVDAEFYNQVVAFASREGVTKSEAVLRLMRTGLASPSQ